MGSRVTITIAGVSLDALLDESATAQAVLSALPLEAPGHRWGDEIYFRIPVIIDESDDARQDMAVGELAYWPEGRAFCIFFGPTPASLGPEPRAYAKVNPFGRILGDASALRAVKEGDVVRVEPAESED